MLKEIQIIDQVIASWEDRERGGMDSRLDGRLKFPCNEAQYFH